MEGDLNYWSKMEDDFNLKLNATNNVIKWNFLANPILTWAWHSSAPACLYFKSSVTKCHIVPILINIVLFSDQNELKVVPQAFMIESLCTVKKVDKHNCIDNKGCFNNVA